MRWLLKRALLLWLALIALCAAGVGIGKLDRAPDTLQTLGFDLCDGEPCFRGIKPGMSWAEARRQYPHALVSKGELLLPLNDLDDTELIVRQSADGLTVQSLSILSTREHSFVPALVQGNPPCRILLFGGPPRAATLVYPHIGVGIVFVGNTADPYLNRIKIKLYARTVVIHNSKDACLFPVDNYTGIWHGFASMRTYLNRFRREAAASKP